MIGDIISQIINWLTFAIVSGVCLACFSSEVLLATIECFRGLLGSHHNHSTKQEEQL